MIVVRGADGRRWRLPMGGFQVIRGPRPPSVRWPSARSPFSGTVKPNSTPPRGRWRQERVNDEEVWESAKKRVLGLEAAISTMIAIGIDDVFRGDIVEGFSGEGEAECSRAQCVDSIEGSEGVRNQGATSGGRRFRCASQVHRVRCRGLSVEGKTCNDGGGTTTFEGGSCKGAPCRADDRRSSQRCRNSSSASPCRGSGAMVDRPELRVEECSALPGHTHDCPHWSTHRQGCQQVFTVKSGDQQRRTRRTSLSRAHCPASGLHSSPTAPVQRARLCSVCVLNPSLLPKKCQSEALLPKRL